MLQSSFDAALGLVRASTIHFSQFVPVQGSGNPVFVTSPPALPDGVVGTPYAQQLQATGGTSPYSWSLAPGSALAPGLTLSSQGAVAGTPTAAGVFAFLVVVADAAGQTVQLAMTLTSLPLVVEAADSGAEVPEAGDASVAADGGEMGATLADGGMADDAGSVNDSTMSDDSVALDDATSDAAEGDAAGDAASADGGAPSGCSAPSLALGPVSVIAGGPDVAISAVSSTQYACASPGHLFCPGCMIGMVGAGCGSELTGGHFVFAGQALGTTVSRIVVQQGTISTCSVCKDVANATVPAALITTPGVVDITFVNSSGVAGASAFFVDPPDGGMSRFVPPGLPCLNPTPVPSGVSPSTIVAGSGPTLLTLAGANFTPGATVTFAGPLPAITLKVNVLSATSAQVSVPAGYVAAPGAATVTVSNPLPGGGDSAPLPIPITAPNAAGVPSCASVAVATAVGVPLAPAIKPSNVVLDACNVYWTDTAVGGLWRVAKDGSSAVQMAPSTAPSGQSMESRALAIDANNVYWSEDVPAALADGGVAAGAGDVVQTSLSTGVSNVIWRGSDSPNAIAVDASYVYVLQPGDVERIPIGGGAVKVVSSQGGTGGSLIVAGSNVMWTTGFPDNAIWQAPAAGGATSTFISGTTGWTSAALVLDGTNVVWSTYVLIPATGYSGQVLVTPLTGGTINEIASGNATFTPLFLAVSPQFVYATINAYGSVLKLPMTGSGTTIVPGHGPGSPTGIAVDGVNVYWAEWFTNAANPAGGSYSINAAPN
jgi:hypothetical protein